MNVAVTASEYAPTNELNIRRLTITSSLMQCPFPYKMGSIGYWASAYWKIFFICRPSEIKFTVILFPLQLIWIRWSLSIRSENATLTSQQPSDELLKKKWSLPNYIAPLEKLLVAHVKQRTVVAIDSHRQQSTLPSTCVDFDSWYANQIHSLWIQECEPEMQHATKVVECLLQLDKERYAAWTPTFNFDSAKLNSEAACAKQPLSSFSTVRSRWYCRTKVHVAP